jgi:hypothetical protein
MQLLLLVQRWPCQVRELGVLQCEATNTQYTLQAPSFPLDGLPTSCPGVLPAAPLMQVML